MLLACVVVSGAAALAYETAWNQRLGAAFGASPPAVAAVLVATMGGLALGSALAGRLGHRLKRPVLAYAAFELGIGASALLVGPLVSVSRRLQAAVLGAASLDALPPAPASVAFYVAASALVLLVPTALMGATLPVLAGAVVDDDARLGPRIGGLYAANTLGGAAGALLASLVLLPRLGLGATIHAMATANLAVAACAALLGRRAPVRVAASPRPGSTTGRFWVLPVVGASGFVGFALEVMWTPLLARLLGTTVRGFGLVLGVFLAGLALGSAVAARRARDEDGALGVLVASQLVVGFAGLGAFVLLPHLVPASGPLTAWRAVRLAAIVAPAAAGLGAAFPAVVRLAAGGAAEATAAAGRALWWNTGGAILGALCTTFVLMPALRFAGTAKLLAVIAVLLAAATAFGAGPRRRRELAATLAAAGVVALLPVATPWTVLQRSILGAGSPRPPVFYEVGYTATVVLDDEGGGGWRLTTDGLPESAIQRPGAWAGGNRVVRWLSMLAVAARPDAASMLVVGLGAGQTVQDLPASLTRVDVVEIESEVVAANRAFAERRRRDPLADPRVHVHVQDARSALALSASRFDAVVSQPSHPWTAGASHLFTREFFALVRERLGPDGVLVQWLALPFVDEARLRSLLATLVDVFPHVELYSLEGRAFLFVASPAPLEMERTAGVALRREPTLWRRLGAWAPEDVLAARVLDTAGVRRFAGNAPLTTDDRNAFAYRTEELLDSEDRPRLRAALALESPAPADPATTARRLVARGDAVRARTVAGAIDDAVVRDSLVGLADIRSGRTREGERRCAEANALARFALEPLQCLFVVHRTALAHGEKPALARALDADPASRAVIEADRAVAAGRWPAAQRLDDALAAVPERHPFFVEALEARVAWRLASGEPPLAREAVPLVEDLLSLSETPQRLRDRDTALGLSPGAAP